MIVSRSEINKECGGVVVCMLGGGGCSFFF